ncbi:MAG: glutaredoxin family protein [Azoarcus sp.]|jgi:hypothetical protein|nr:glutaredoxin family protein [Azoarcus sp.]
MIRKIGSLAVALTALSFLSTTAADAQTAYRWTDENGKVHYSDQPPTRGDAEARDFTDNAADPSLPYSLRQTMADFPVKLYIKTNCESLCEDARALLKNRGVPFSEVLLDDDASIASFRKTFGADARVPILTVGSNVLKGFEAGTWNLKLNTVGYPPPPAALKGK